ncbi:hypothetical protein BH11ARM1_BH11ARM1_09070 [soil metagenome]
MNPYLIIGLPLGPSIAASLLKKIEPEKFNLRLEGDRFTLTEMFGHLGESEILLRQRMQLVKASPGCTVAVFDIDDEETMHRLASRSLEEWLGIWKSEREETSSWISGLSSADFAIQFVHPTLGEMKIEDVANMFLGHDQYHIQQLTEFI